MPTGPSRRAGPDAVRGAMMLGVVVMNYHGYLILRGACRRSGGPAGVAYDLFDPWTGPLATRFAATFTLTAGVGVALLADGTPERTQITGRLVRRGLTLYAAGLALDRIWPGTILPYLGAMLMLAAVLWRLPTRAVAAAGAGAALAGFAIRWAVLERALDGRATAWLTDPPRYRPDGLALDMLVNGTHPLLPWLAFFCAGIVVGRALLDRELTTIGVGLALLAAASIVTLGARGARLGVLLGDHPYSRSLVYTASALGTALVAFGVLTRWARHGNLLVLSTAGRLSLTIYVAHVLVFRLLVDWLGLIDPVTAVWGLAADLAFAVAFWVVAVASAGAYARRFGAGPAERLYRLLSG